jgi:hypothetical protein
MASLPQDSENNVSEEYLVEEGKILSESIIWRLQRDYFDNKGIQAWMTSVPFYITSNPFIATQYAKVTARFFQDLAHQGKLVADEPIYMVELGSGHGRFTFHFLTALNSFLKPMGIEHVKWCYVFTDFTQRNLDFVRKHPSFAQLIEQGKFDFALYDIEAPMDMKLQVSGKTLTTGSCQNPMVVIGNYVFDGVRQDCFHVENGQLFEALPRVTAPEEIKKGVTGESMEGLKLEWQNRPCRTDYYPDPSWNQVLRHYTETVHNASFLFPTSALVCLQNLLRISGNKMLMLTADNGYTSMERWENTEGPQIAWHGSFSWLVNYNAMIQWLENRGGDSLSHPFGTGFRVSFLSMGYPFSELPETALVGEDALTFSPDDFLRIRREVRENHSKMSLDLLIAYMRLSNWDPDSYTHISETIIASESFDVEMAGSMWELIQRVKPNIYPLPDTRDPFFELGRLAQKLEKFAEATSLYEQSLDKYGSQWASHFNVGVCYYAQGMHKEAHRHLKKAYKLEPKDELTKKWLDTVRKEIR